MKGGQKLQSGQSAHFVDQHICWCGWCSVTVRFVVSVLLNDPFCVHCRLFSREGSKLLHSWRTLDPLQKKGQKSVSLVWVVGYCRGVRVRIGIPSLWHFSLSAFCEWGGIKRSPRYWGKVDRREVAVLVECWAARVCGSLMEDWLLVTDILTTCYQLGRKGKENIGLSSAEVLPIAKLVFHSTTHARPH